MTKEFNLNNLIQIMRCTYCKNEGSLELINNCFDSDLKIKQYKKSIKCKICGELFPITEDKIPIMWTEGLKKIFLHANNEKIKKLEHNNLSANVKIYDETSDNYQDFSRKHPSLAKKLQNSVKKIISSQKPKKIMHLDYACGPGHVLEWLGSFNFIQVGLDVSLNNLRNARKNTGCTVVCGDASNMPFSKGSFNLITESSGLHHIEDWESTLLESCRVCINKGGIIDSEPSTYQMNWSKFAIFIFNLRFPFYKILSYIFKDKYIFRDIQQAKLNLKAELHHQPGRGLPTEKIQKTLEQNGFLVDLIHSPNTELFSKANPNFKLIILNLLSLRNPWNPKCGNFSVVAKLNKII